MEIIRFKITIYLVIKQNILEFSSESRVHKNEHSAGKSPVCFLVYRNKVRYPTTTVGLCERYRLANQSQRQNDLQHRIIEAIDKITDNMLARTRQEIEYQLAIVRATDGAHVEVY